MTHSPAEIYELQSASALKKSKTPFSSTLVLGILGGFFIAMGSFGSTYASHILAATDPGMAKFVAASIFPVGLMFCVLAGGELFTGNCIVGLSVMRKEGSLASFLKNLLAVFVGNYIGSIFFALLLFYGGVFKGEALISAVRGAAEAKVHLGFLPALLKGYLCNVAVVGGIWLQTAAKEVAGKILAMWFAIMIFIVSGFEHVVANMYYLSAGLMLGAEFSVPEMLWGNILPVTLGNALSGIFALPLAYHWLYGRKR